MMTFTVSGRDYPTKKSFKEAVAHGYNVRFNSYDHNGRWSRVTLHGLQDREGLRFTVTDEVSRRWFAEVVVMPDMKFKVI